MEAGLYWNENLQAVRRRVPSGGTGGGQTSFADEAVSSEEANPWLAENRPAQVTKPEPEPQVELVPPAPLTEEMQPQKPSES